MRAMLTVAELRAETRATARARLRDLTLDAARTMAVERGWNAVRMGELAAAIGTSRQTLHTEFGTKEDLGEALVTRETAAFIDGVAQRLAAHPGDLGGAVYEAVAFTLHATAANPLLQIALTGANTGDDTLLPLLTTRSEPLLHRADDMFGDWVTSQWPDRKPEDVRIMVESAVRLLMSHVVASSVAPEVAARDIAVVACRCFGFPDPDPDTSQVTS